MTIKWERLEEDASGLLDSDALSIDEFEGFGFGSRGCAGFNVRDAILAVESRTRDETREGKEGNNIVSLTA